MAAGALTPTPTLNTLTSNTLLLGCAGLEVPPSQSEWPITEFVAMMLRATAQCDAAAFDSGTNHLMKAAHRMRCSLIADDDPADLAAEAEQLRGRLEELEEEHTAVQRAVEVEFEAQGRTLRSTWFHVPPGSPCATRYRRWRTERGDRVQRSNHRSADQQGGHFGG